MPSLIEVRHFSALHLRSEDDDDYYYDHHTAAAAAAVLNNDEDDDDHLAGPIKAVPYSRPNNKSSSPSRDEMNISHTHTC